MKLLCVILNYKTAPLVVRGLQALSSEVKSLPSMEVVVTDNDSQDGSAELIGAAIEREQYTWARVVPLPKNGGFNYGNNAGFEPYLHREGRPEYVLLLNPDAQPLPGALSTLVGFMDSHPEVGIAGAQLQHEDGELQRSAFRLPSVVSEFINGIRTGVVRNALRRWDVLYDDNFTEPTQVEWVSGAALMVRTTVFDQIGTLDEKYFLYFDELDFCARAHRAGVLCYSVPQSRVAHIRGASTGIVDSKSRGRMPAYWFESRRRFFVKNLGPVRATLADLAFVVGRLLYRVRAFVQRRNNDDPPQFLRDFFRHSTFGSGFRID